MKFVLSGLIDKSISSGGFTGAIIYGAQRLGKSSYAAQVMYDIYKDWEVVNAHTLFELTDVVDLLYTAMKERRRIPVINWDDAGVFGNKMRYFEDRSLVQYLQNLTDVVGLSLGCLLLTTPSPNNLLKALRGYEFYRCKIYPRDKYNGRTAVGYQSSLLPSGSRIIHRKFRDNYNVRLPDEFWKPYLVKRQGYLDVAITNLQGIIGSGLSGGADGPADDKKSKREKYFPQPQPWEMPKRDASRLKMEPVGGVL